jgi:hypothetical protein
MSSVSYRSEGEQVAVDVEAESDSEERMLRTGAGGMGRIQELACTADRAKDDDCTARVRAPISSEENLSPVSPQPHASSSP